jgi:hypothetical protein
VVMAAAIVVWLLMEGEAADATARCCLFEADVPLAAWRVAPHNKSPILPHVIQPRRWPTADTSSCWQLKAKGCTLCLRSS